MNTDVTAGGRYEDRRSGRRYKEDDPEIRLARLETEYADCPSVEGTFIPAIPRALASWK